MKTTVLAFLIACFTLFFINWFFWDLEISPSIANRLPHYFLHCLVICLVAGVTVGLWTKKFLYCNPLPYVLISFVPMIIGAIVVALVFQNVLTSLLSFIAYLIGWAVISPQISKIWEKDDCPE